MLDSIASCVEHPSLHGVCAFLQLPGYEGVEGLAITFYGTHEQSGCLVDVGSVGPGHTDGVVTPGHPQGHVSTVLPAAVFRQAAGSLVLCGRSRA
ncbi:hypothetical protein [Streptomyces sp. NBC_01718]|uniref:hypothetical protein n=1 Tax=Streptomyces sp. NBC_01718 TaxID=2975919 RepID=UPI00352C824A